MPSSDAVRQRILDSVSDIVVNDGVAAVTRRAVAGATGLDEDAIAALYPSHEQLLHDLLDRELDAVRRAVAADVERDPLGGRLSRIFHYSLSAVYEHRLARSLYLLDGESLRSIIRTTHGTPSYPRLGADRAFLREMQRCGMVRTDVDIDDLTAVLSAVMAGVAITAPHDDLDSAIAGLVLLLERSADTDATDTEPGKRALFDMLAGRDIDDDA